MNHDFEHLSQALKSGEQHQESTTRQIMLYDIQQLKKDVQTLRKALNHIQDFLKKAYP